MDTWYETVGDGSSRADMALSTRAEYWLKVQMAYGLRYAWQAHGSRLAGRRLALVLATLSPGLPPA